MAYLNVRERRLELRLLYVGPPGAGKATTLRALTGLEKIDPGAPLTWTSAPRSCGDLEVSVALALASDALPNRDLAAQIQEADAVVFVASAEATMQSDNARSLAACVKHLEDRPLVIQWNKVDLAKGSEAALATLRGDRALVAIETQAVGGLGLTEAAEAAVSAALERTRRRAETDPHANTMDRHPLLGALREAMRATVSVYVDELEHRTSSAIALQLEPLVKAQAALGVRLANIESAQARTRDDQKVLLGELRQLGTRSDALQLQLDAITSQQASTTVRVDETLLAVQKGHSLVARRDDVATLGQQVLAQLEKRGAQESTSALSVGKSLATLGQHIEATRGAIEVALHRETQRSGAQVQEEIQQLQARVAEPLEQVQTTTGEIRAIFEELLSDQQKKKGWFR